MTSGAVLTSCRIQCVTSKTAKVIIAGLLFLGAAVFVLVNRSCHFKLTTAIHINSILLSYNIIQGGSNMTGTNLYVNKCKQSRSYLNHLVYLTIR